MSGGEIAVGMAANIFSNAVSHGINWAASRVTDHRQSHFEKQLATLALSAGLDHDRRNYVVTINDTLPANLIANLLPPASDETLLPNVKQLTVYNVIDSWLKHSFHAPCACYKTAGRIYQSAGAELPLQELVASFGTCDTLSPALINDLDIRTVASSAPSHPVDYAASLPHAITRSKLNSCQSARKTTSRNIACGFLLQAVLAARGLPSKLLYIQYDHTTIFETDVFETRSVYADSEFTVTCKSCPESVYEAVEIVRCLWGEDAATHRAELDDLLSRAVDEANKVETLSNSGGEDAATHRAELDDLFSRAVDEANKVETLSNSAAESWIDALRAYTHRKLKQAATIEGEEITARLIDALRAADLRCIADLKDVQKFVGCGGLSSQEATKHFESYRVDYSFYERHSDLICDCIEALDDHSLAEMQQIDLRSPIMNAVFDRAKKSKIEFVNADDRTILPRSIKYMLMRKSTLWSSRKQSIAITSKSIAIATPVVGTSIFMETGVRPAHLEFPALGEREDEGPYMVAVLAARLLVDLNEFDSLKFAAKYLSSLTSMPPSEVKALMADLLQRRLFRQSVANNNDLLKLSSIYETSERMFGKGEVAVKTAFRTVSAVLERGVKLTETKYRCACLNKFFGSSVVAGVLVDTVIEFKDLVKLKTLDGSVALGLFRRGQWSVKARLVEKRAGLFHAEEESEDVYVDECEELLSGDLS